MLHPGVQEASKRAGSVEVSQPSMPVVLVALCLAENSLHIASKASEVLVKERCGRTAKGTVRAGHKKSGLVAAREVREDMTANQ